MGHTGSPWPVWATRPLEILNVGLLRANLCERHAVCADQGTRKLRTVGLLSVMDLMLSQPLAGLMDQLPLSDQVKRAIVAHEGGYGQLLEAAVTLERNEWPHGLVRRHRARRRDRGLRGQFGVAFNAMELLRDA